MSTLFEQGGLILGVILALSLLAWTLIALKWMQLHSERAREDGWTEVALGHLARGERDQARALCVDRRDLLGGHS